ncbi:MAG: hypothetical protein ACR2MS_09210 [Weeksellaceae bacterium]
MKKIIYTLIALVAFSMVVNAQVGVETEEVSPNAILDFPGDGVNTYADKGILLPYVTDPATAGTEPGTLVYNSTTGVVEIRDNAGWVQFSKLLKDEINTGVYDGNYTELESTNKGVVISDLPKVNEANVEGVLVLESESKALALPKVDKVEDLGAAKAGTICYDMSRKALAVFNGEVWTMFY